MNYKRFLSKVLVFIIVFNSLFFINDVKKVEAATEVLNQSFKRTLKPGKENPTPVDEYSNIPEEQALFWWDFEKMNGVGVENGTFKFSYFIEDMKKAVLTITKTGDTANVKYDLFDFTSGALVPKIDTASYKVHTNIDSNGENFIPAATYINGAFNGTNPSYQVNNVPPLTPNFTISRDTGYSFKYGNNTMHFMWNKADKKFYFATNGISKGKIFDMELNYTDNGTINGTDIQKVLSGISTYTFRAIPFANNGVTVDKNLDIDTDLKQYAKILNLSTNPADPHPGSEEVELLLRFDLPKAIDPVTKKYNIIPNNYDLPISIVLGNSAASKEIQVKIKNLLDLTTPSSNITINSSATINNYRVLDINGNLDSSNNPLKDRVEIRLGNLTPGNIYNSASIYVTDESNIFSNVTLIPFPKVFTFVKYNVVSIGGKFYAVIQPYSNYKGYYMLKSGVPLAPSIIQYSEGTKAIIMPLVVNSQNQFQERYQVFFSPDKAFVNNDTTNSIYSQIVDFKGNTSATTVGTPNNFEVLSDYTLVPEKDTPDGTKGLLNMKVRWDIENKSIIDAMIDASPTKSISVVYDLYNQLSPEHKEKTAFSKVTMKIYLENGEVYVEYSDNKGQILNTQKQKLKIVIDPETNEFVYVSEIEYQIQASHRENPNVNIESFDFLYPNIYFINAKPISTNDILSDLGGSLYSSITLNDLTKQDVPPPQNLEIDNIITSSVAKGELKDQVSFDLKYDIPSGRIKEYIENSYPYPKQNIDIKVNLYVSENEAYMKDVFSKFNFKDRKDNSVLSEYQSSYGQNLYFSDINANTAMTSSEPGTPLDALRKDKVVRIGNIDLGAYTESIVTSGSALSSKFTFDGMDKNQRYFILADIVVTHKDSGEVILLEKASSLSNIVGVLTKGEKSDIDANEKIPSAPELNLENVDTDEATLFWDKIHSLNQDGTEEQIEYEIIRLKDEQMPANLLETRNNFDDFFKNILKNPNKLGFRTDQANIEIFNGTGYSPADKNLYIYNQLTEIIKLTDKTLSPNQLFFYYVRTVRIVDGKRIYSIWSNISVTTWPVDNPINLRITTDKMKYDPKKEFVIEFDAPLEDVSKLGTDYFLEYTLKEDDKDFSGSMKMDSKLLIANATKSTIEGYSHFVYKIERLMPATFYTIKVRMLDKRGDASLYSNIASTRTEIDQEEYEKEKESNDWIDLLKKELDKLIKDNYFIANDNKNILEILYRPTTFDNYINEWADGNIVLPTSDAPEKIYYFPASSLQKLNDKDKGFSISHGDMEIMISADSVNYNTNQAIKEITEKIKGLHIEDYYLKVSVNFKDITKNVEGNEPISTEATVTFEVVGSIKNNKVFDDKLFDLLVNRVNKQAGISGLKNKIKDMIGNDTRKEEIVKIVDRLVAETKQDFAVDIKRELSTAIKYSMPIENLDAPIYIILKQFEADADIKGYQNVSGNYLSIEVEAFGDNKAILTKTPGSYIFTGKIINIIGIEYIAGAERFKNIISKYNLQDAFGRDVFSLSDNITKNTAVLVTARVLGAKKGEDSIKFLKNKGITISSRNLYEDITLQESIYIFMNIYEGKTKTKIDTINIKNKNWINTIKNIDEKNKKSIEVAYEVGIYKNEKMNPNELVNIFNVMTMLEKINY